ncbi:hypothetical protein A2856_00485 [Candidatus Uhrbacteria bacterium RIFCSPHIGHO2_01_FULL_63_20]|uniref:DUF11 domain-containing protein n=1 Tax=Candidatus Uhrbacteria bacterium RIFCSPHIGHO2_01_FULL_63_20 TaxID=1802385 RepID=A0A1F7TLV6_9BACT|nr:MAG: hypothetical protein A2856_00485 [Candidatus Uhrbacteria bacterium RIFCSPHIGHO2_01_FULL_63_20]
MERAKHEKDLARDLQAIYAEPDGELPDLSTLGKPPRAKLHRILIGVLVALSVVSSAAWAGFFLITRGWGGSGQVLAASVEGPESVRAGEEVFFTVRYKDDGRVPIAQLEFELNLPDSFHVTSAVPAPDEGMTWRVGSLTPGSDGAVSVGGYFRSEVPSAQTLQAAFTYRPANFSSDFRDFKSLAVHVDDTTLKLAVNGPAKALAGDQVQYVLEALNAGTLPLERVRLIADLPKDFRFASSDPAPAAPGVPAWDLPAIAPGATAAVTLKGSYTATADGTQAVTVRGAFVEEDRELAQAAASANTDMLGGAMDFHLVVNGGTDDLSLDPGALLRLSLDYGNHGAQVVNDVSFRLTAEGADAKPLPVDWEAATGVAEGVRVKNVLVWDKTSVPELAALAPGAEGVIDVSVPLLSAIDPSKIGDRLILTLTGTVQKVGSVAGPRTISATPIKVSVNSDFAATAEARYFTPDGEPVGQGPLPPKAGQTTTYRVYWTLSNRLHPLEGLRMSTTLPAHAGWIDRKDAQQGTLAYDSVTRTASWTIPAWPADQQTVQAWFDVAVVPDASDAGSFLKLTNAAGAEAADTVTKSRLSRVISDLTSELPTDADAKGKGVVVD